MGLIWAADKGHRENQNKGRKGLWRRFLVANLSDVSWRLARTMHIIAFTSRGYFWYFLTSRAISQTCSIHAVQTSVRMFPPPLETIKSTIWLHVLEPLACPGSSKAVNAKRIPRVAWRLLFVQDARHPRRTHLESSMTPWNRLECGLSKHIRCWSSFSLQEWILESSAKLIDQSKYQNSKSHRPSVLHLPPWPLFPFLQPQIDQLSVFFSGCAAENRTSSQLDLPPGTDRPTKRKQVSQEDPKRRWKEDFSTEQTNHRPARPAGKSPHVPKSRPAFARHPQPMMIPASAKSWTAISPSWMYHVGYRCEKAESACMPLLMYW